MPCGRVVIYGVQDQFAIEIRSRSTSDSVHSGYDAYSIEIKGLAREMVQENLLFTPSHFGWHRA